MTAPSIQPPRPPVFRWGWVISLVIHAGIIGLLVWFAARGGMLGESLRTVTVRLLPPAPEVSPVAKPPAPPVQKNVSIPDAVPREMPPPVPAKAQSSRLVPNPTPALTAPAPAEVPSFAFDDGGRTVQTEKDPAALYRSFVEFSLHSRWNRPTDIADSNYVAEVEITVATDGRVSDARWRRQSGDARWDAAVMAAVAPTRRLDRPPPPGFPPRVTVRFDVIRSAEMELE
jgi:protein TonB